MAMPLENLEIDLTEYEDADVKVKQLAAFCGELLEAIKYTISI